MQMTAFSVASVAILLVAQTALELGKPEAPEALTTNYGSNMIFSKAVDTDEAVTLSGRAGDCISDEFCFDGTLL